MTDTDLVVVIPGITGSTLAKEGKLVWSPSAGSVLRAIATFGRSIRQLELPGDIGDGHPGDGVEAVALMPDLAVLPGVWTPIVGYDVLVKRLEKNGFRQSTADSPGNLVLFPYDWRLSNRYTGERLKSVVEPALDRWRSQGGQFADAKICFVCHSMGGLVARWYIAKHGGLEHTRKLITLGTPYRGAAKSLDQLVHGSSKAGLDFTAFVRSMPSSYQLLPSYACVESPSGLRHLGELQTVPDLDTTRLHDAMSFAKQLEDVEAGMSGLDEIRCALTGIEQTTLSTARITRDSVEILDTVAGKNVAGDGTVPAYSGPLGVKLNSPLLKRIGEKHGALQANSAVLDEVLGIVLVEDRAPLAAPGTIPDVVVPEVLTAGDDLAIEVTLGSGAGIRVTVCDEAGRLVASRQPRSPDGRFRAVVSGLAPGAYGVDVTPTDGGPAVHSHVLAWSQEAAATA